MQARAKAACARARAITQNRRYGPSWWRRRRVQVACRLSESGIQKNQRGHRRQRAPAVGRQVRQRRAAAWKLARRCRQVRAPARARAKMRREPVIDPENAAANVVTRARRNPRRHGSAAMLRRRHAVCHARMRRAPCYGSAANANQKAATPRIKQKAAGSRECL